LGVPLNAVAGVEGGKKKGEGEELVRLLFLGEERKKKKGGIESNSGELVAKCVHWGEEKMKNADKLIEGGGRKNSLVMAVDIDEFHQRGREGNRRRSGRRGEGRKRGEKHAAFPGSEFPQPCLPTGGERKERGKKKGM